VIVVPVVINLTASWTTNCVFVLIDSAIIFVKVAMVSVWLLMVSDFATAALARASKDELILLAVLLRVFCLAPEITIDALAWSVG
jgi:hypothetical protein